MYVPSYSREVTRKKERKKKEKKKRKPVFLKKRLRNALTNDWDFFRNSKRSSARKQKNVTSGMTGNVCIPLKNINNRLTGICQENGQRDNRHNEM